MEKGWDKAESDMEDINYIRKCSLEHGYEELFMIKGCRSEIKKEIIMKKLCLLLSLAFVLLLCVPVNARSSEPGFIRVEAGEAFVVALKSDGTVWTWGSNMNGALGDGTERSRYVPARIEGIDNVVDIATGLGFTIALKSDGTVWGWGNNVAQSLGISNDITIAVHRPTQLAGMKNIVAINCSWFASFALDVDGKLYTYGPSSEVAGGFSYKKEDPSGEFKIVASNGGRSFYPCLGIKEDGSVWLDSKELKEFHGAKDVAISRDFSDTAKWIAYIVTADGRLMTTGSNRSGRLGNGFTSQTNVPYKISDVSDVADVSALHNIYVVHNDGTVSTMYNRNSASRFKKLPIDNVKKIVQTINGVFALKSDGTVWTWSFKYDEPSPEPPKISAVNGLSNIVNICATQGSVLAFDNSERAYLVHSDGFSSYGDADNAKMGYIETHTLILLTIDNKVVINNYDYSSYDPILGNYPIRNSYVFTNTELGSAAKTIDTELSTPIILKEDGTVCRLWVVDAGSEVKDVPGLRNIVDIKANFYSFLALDSNGNVWQNGKSSTYPGSEDNLEYRQPYRVPSLSNIKAIAAGKDYYFAITNAGELYAWGENGNNELFTSDFYTNYTSWKPVKSSAINMTIGNDTILVNNREVKIPAAPVIINSRTLVPIREVVENLGGTVDWETSGKITINIDDNILILNIDSFETQYNEEREMIDVAPALMNAKTFLPLRYVCEKLGADVLWEETSSLISITK